MSLLVGQHCDAPAERPESQLRVRLSHALLRPLARYRVRHHAYRYPAELRTLDALHTLKRRLAGQSTGMRAVEYA